MPRIEDYRYEGGPLHGKEAVPPRRGAWPLYQDEHGGSMPTPKGDRWSRKRTEGGRVPVGFYARQQEEAAYVWRPPTS